MKLALHDVGRVVGLAFVMMIWEMIPLSLYVGYLMVSTAMGGGHPRPADPRLLFGLIPAGIFSVYGTATYLLLRQFPVYRKLLRDWRTYAAAGLVHALWIAAVLLAVLLDSRIR